MTDRVLGVQFSAYPAPGEEAGSPFAKVYGFYGKGVDALFGAEPERLHRSAGGAEITIPAKSASDLIEAPWPRAPRTKDNPRGYDPGAVTSILRQPPQLEKVDPRMLHSTQPKVTYGGAAYYATDEYHQTGRTYADQGNVGNAYPVIYHSTESGRNLILAGHHRATAALALGRPLLARRVEGQ